MPAPRKFDHDEARALHQQGLAFAEIARRMDVTPGAIPRIVSDDVRRRQLAYQKEWQGRHNQCDDCGKPISYVRHKHRPPAKYCKVCYRNHSRHVRAAEMECRRCHQWKPDNGFHLDHGTAEIRRGRAQICKSCSHADRKERRQRNRVPCIEGCGRLVLHPSQTVKKTGRCLSCAMKRVAKQKRAA